MTPLICSHGDTTVFHCQLGLHPICPLKPSSGCVTSWTGAREWLPDTGVVNQDDVRVLFTHWDILFLWWPNLTNGQKLWLGSGSPGNWAIYNPAESGFLNQTVVRFLSHSPVTAEVTRSLHLDIWSPVPYTFNFFYSIDICSWNCSVYDCISVESYCKLMNMSDDVWVQVCSKCMLI